MTDRPTSSEGSSGGPSPADAQTLYEKRYGAGGRPPEFDFLHRFAPAFAPGYDEARQRLLGIVYTPSDPVFPVKYREMVAATIIAVRGFPSVEHHLRRAIREGASMPELIEAMTVAAISGGFRTLVFGLGFLAKLANELEIEPDPPPSFVVTAGPGDGLDERTGYAVAEFDWMRRWTPEYDDARRDLLSFIQTPVGSALPVRYREIITAGILAFRGDPATETHLRRALREGASMRELIEAMQVAGVPGGAPTLQFALGCLMRIAEELGIAPDR